MIAEQRGGVFSIDQPEYDALKKNLSSSTPSSAPWREEMSRRGIEVNHRPLAPQPSIEPAPAAAEINRPSAIPNMAGATGNPPEPVRPKATKRK